MRASSRRWWVGRLTSSIHDILAELRDDARNNRDLGDKFERLIQAFLSKDPYYADLFSDVWLWMEWPDRAEGLPAFCCDLAARAEDCFCSVLAIAFLHHRSVQRTLV